MDQHFPTSRRRLLAAASGAAVLSAMAGCSLTVTLLDDETARLWDAPVHTPALRWGM